MRNKLVTDIPGIGRVTGENMNVKGVTMAYHVLGQFLVLSTNEADFKRWVLTFGADSRRQQQCYDCMIAWCTQHL